MSLLRSCRSEICPETADRSFWNVDRNDSRESSRFTLVCVSVSIPRMRETADGMHLDLVVEFYELLSAGSVF